MSRFTGAQARVPMFARGGNKGAVASLRHIRRTEAESRNERTEPGRRSTKRRARRERASETAKEGT